MVYVIDSLTDGESSPLRSFGGDTNIIDKLYDLAVDPTHKEVYLASFDNSSIVVYPQDATESTMPSRILSSIVWGAIPLEYILASPT